MRQPLSAATKYIACTGVLAGALTVLVSCGAPQDRGTATRPDTHEIPYGQMLDTQYKLPNGRTVTCVYFKPQYVPDCDWAHQQ